MKKEQEPIIIKKINRGHEGHHGGAWKVAYADFVTAMMALFLVLWLVAMLSIEAKKGIGEYFRSYTIFKGSGAGGGKGISILPGSPVRLREEPGDTEKSRIMERLKLASEITKIVEEKVKELKDQILIFTTSEGVRIELVEKVGSPMFELGKAQILPRCEKSIKIIASALKDVPYNISIEGHTDRYQYPSHDYTNWELAADRANAARRLLIKYGLAPEKIVKVTSYADRIPIKPDDPYDAMNRRVSILIEINNSKPSSPQGKTISAALGDHF